jgi:4'-phosphopantetheinyl transferase
MPDPIFRLKPGELHVWIFNLDSPNQVCSPWEGLVSEDETRRSEKYHFERDRLRFIARRGILRLLLGKYTGRDPAGITYVTNPHGKLCLPFQPVKFNLSKCQNRVAFVFMLENEVGIDLEQIHPLAEFELLEKRLFSPLEQAGLSALAPGTQLDAFFHTWTQKEAFLKAHGEGLSLPLQDFSVSVDPNLAGELKSFNWSANEILHWKMYTQVQAGGWRVAVCAGTETPCKVLWHAPELADFVSMEFKRLYSK